MTHDELVALVEDLQRRVTQLEDGIPTRSTLAEDPYFEKFWQLYPRKVGKVDARKAWRSLTAGEMQAALSRVALYAQVWSLAPADRQQFVKHPATWLRGKAWEDGEVEWKRVAWNGKGPAIERALVGAHTEPMTPKREIGAGSPFWVKAVAGAISDTTLRPSVPDHLVTLLLNWEAGAEPDEPTAWRELIADAYAEARELAR